MDRLSTGRCRQRYSGTKIWWLWIRGHGGLDPGKVGVNGAEEKDINLKIALNIKSYLEKENIEVFMTRTSDERLSDTQVGDLKERVRLNE